MSRLSQAFEFSERDLAANRQGRITRLQKAKLARKRGLFVISYGFLAAILAAISIPLVRDAMIDIRQVPHDLNHIFPAITVGLGLPVAAVCLAILIIRTWVQFTADIREGHAAAIYGTVYLPLAPAWAVRRTSYRLRIVSLSLEIPKQALDAIEDGETYQVYYSPRTKVVLSLEYLKRKRDGQIDFRLLRC